MLVPCILYIHGTLLQTQDADISAPGAGGDVEKDIPLKLINFKLPPPRALSETECQSTLKSAIARIRDTPQELNHPPDVLGQTAHVGLPASDMWMLLLVRMVTRAPTSDETMKEGQVKEESDLKLVKTLDDDRRRTLCNYVLEDFSSR
jgi:symplekin